MREKMKRKDRCDYEMKSAWTIAAIFFIMAQTPLLISEKESFFFFFHKAREEIIH